MRRPAIVTVSYNSASDLSTFWRHARDLDANWIVVDNGSTDASADVAEGLGAMVIRLGRNVGFSRANNIGARASDADVILFANPDVEVSADGLEVLARLVRQSHAVVAPQLLNADGTAQENGRQAPFLYRKLLHFSGAAASRESYEVVVPVGVVRDVAWVIGAAVMFPRGVFDAIGGWDDRFFVYYEDSDICLRARRAGYSVRITGNVRWVHGWARETRRGINLRAWRLEAASALKFYSRYPRLLLHPRLLRQSRATEAQDPKGLHEARGARA